MNMLDVNCQGQLTLLGRVLARPSAGLFRMVVQKGECWEELIRPEDQSYQIEKTENKIILSLDHLRSIGGIELKIALKMVIEEADGEIRFTGSIENQDDATVTDFYYPSLGLMKSLGDGEPELIWPGQAGCRYPNIGQQLARNTGREMEHQMALQYPGGFAEGGSMNYLMLRDEENIFYLGNHDPRFHSGTLRVFGDPEGEGLVGAEIGRMAFVVPGETWEIPQAVCMIRKGSWHQGAKRYRAFADTWFKKRMPPEWVRKMNGYFLVINKQQYRKSCWPYETLPELYDHAQAHGLDVLGLFGWYETGHDNGYPDLWPAKDLGGEDALKKGLKAVHEKGGRATLYYQGNLIDTGSDFYKKHGEEAEGKNRWGQPYIQCFDKAQSSDFLRLFSGKWFSTACPGQPIWRECMKEKARLAFEYGADAVLYDQIGGMPAYLCFNKDHHHAKPSTSYVEGRHLLLGDILRQAEENGPEFGFFSEHITDVYAQYLDCIHGMYTYPYGNESKGHFPELFRYTFPECMMTVRNGNPFMDPRLVNYAIAYGMKYEMEIRYVTDKEFLLADKAPEKRKYAHDMAQLRRRHENALLLGTFLDDEGVQMGGGLIGKRFRGDGEEVLVIWNDSEEEKLLDAKVEGFEIISVDGIAGEIDKNCPLAPQSLVVAKLKAI